jgi:ATP-dependent DNA ligase
LRSTDPDAKGKEKQEKWLFINITPDKPINIKKPHYKQIDEETARKIIRNLQPGSSVQAKIDGARTLLRLADGTVEAYSQRASVTGNPIIYTEKLFRTAPKIVTDKEISDKDVARALRNSMLVGETYAVRREGEKEVALSPQQISGILNASTRRALELLKNNDAALKVMLFDVVEMGGKPLKDWPYQNRFELLQKLVKYLPQDVFTLPENITNKDLAMQLLKQIKAGKHPLTREGIILWTEKGPVKVKFRKDYDVYIRKVFPGTGKYADGYAGGFYYSYTPTGRIVGKVGTGFDDEMRKDMWEHPEYYLGRRARVIAQEKYPSGALRAPSFLALHEDYPQVPTDEEEKK